MNIGMLWFDNDPKADLGIKIQRAAQYYREKYGVNPNVCFVHPSMLKEQPDNTASPVKKGEVEVRINGCVLPNHLWLGVNTAG
jgi:hypothetical protein